MRSTKSLVLAFSLLAAGLVGGAIAQEKGVTSLATDIGAHANPSLTGYARGIRDEANRRDFAIRRLDVEAEVRGAIAELTLDMQFAGRSEGNSEAWLHIDLPAGAVVTGYSLDIDGVLVDGVLIDQQQGREVYERKVRQGIDPGIAEVDRTGGLNVRISPVDSDKGRHVRVRFVAPIDRQLRFPLITAPGSGTWSVNVHGIEQGASASLGGKPLVRSGPVAVAAGTGRVDTMLVLTPQVAPAIASRHPGTNETYWQLSGDLPATLVPTGGTMRIYWDRSRSMREINLAAILPRLKDAISALQPTTIEFVSFNSAASSSRIVTPGDELTRAIRSVRYGGASSLTPVAGGTRADTCILVSDGRQTIDTVGDWRPDCRLFAIPAGTQADRDALSDLANRGGGRVIERPGQPEDWRQPGIERIVDASGGPLDFTSLGSGRKYRVIVNNPSGGPVRLIVAGKSIDAPIPSDVRPFAGEAVLLAARSLARVEAGKGHQAFVAMSRRYSVASPTLSFIVLETPEDYLDNKIDPPANYPRMADYREQQADAAKEHDSEKGSRFETLLKAWRDEVSWWEKKFDPNAKKPVEAVKPRPANVSGVAAPALPPPPPPAPERDSDGSHDVAADADDAIVVTGSRIARPDLEAPSPVTTVDGDQFDLNGTITVETLINELPQVMAYNRDPANFDRSFRAFERSVGNVPAFYFDSADWLWSRNRRDEAVQTLLSALELPDSDSQTVSIVAARLQRWGKLDLAIQLRERQVMLEPNRPQAKRLLALALAQRAKVGGENAKADYGRAIELLVAVALSEQPRDWEGIDVISLREANALLPHYRALGGTIDLDPRLISNLTADIRVIIDWTVDDVDIDLWIDEPNGERAIYSHPTTAIGGRLSNDMTNGFGPEEYWLRNAPNGAFEIRTNNYRSDRIDPNGRPRLHVRLIRDFGRPDEREESIDYFSPPSKDDKKAEEKPIGRIVIARPAKTK